MAASREDFVDDPGGEFQGGEVSEKSIAGLIPYQLSEATVRGITWFRTAPDQGGTRRRARYPAVTGNNKWSVTLMTLSGGAQKGPPTWEAP